VSIVKEDCELRIGKEVVVAYFKVLSEHLPLETEATHEKTSVWSVSGLRFEPDTSRTRSSGNNPTASLCSTGFEYKNLQKNELNLQRLLHQNLCS
jgi:hypothetical protein